MLGVTGESIFMPHLPDGINEENFMGPVRCTYPQQTTITEIVTTKINNHFDASFM